MKNLSYLYDQFDEEAREFLFTIMSYYQGTTEQKVKRASEFLDDLIFKTKNDLKNPFSNDSRDYYHLAKYAKFVLIPDILKALKILDNSDPFQIHDWN